MRRVLGNSCLFMFIIAIFSIQGCKGCKELNIEQSLNGDKMEVTLDHSCSFSGIHSEETIVLREPETSVQGLITEIMNTTGLARGYKVFAGDVESASAVIVGKERYIVYNPSFMKGVRLTKNGKWIETAILAHMVAHHLSGHNLTREAGRNLTELEADKFVGLTLQKMGADQEQATEALNTINNGQSGEYYPETSSRISALQSGWSQSRGYESQDFRYSGRAYDADKIPTRSSSLSNAEIVNFLMRWSQSQSYYDFQNYVDCYSYSFQGMKMNKRGRRVYFDYDGWMRDREEMYARATNLNVSASDIRIISQDDWGTTIQFTQNYYSDSYQDTGEKVMKIRKDSDGSMRIVYEEMLSSY